MTIANMVGVPVPVYISGCLAIVAGGYPVVIKPGRLQNHGKSPDETQKVYKVYIFWENDPFR